MVIKLDLVRQAPYVTGLDLASSPDTTSLITYGGRNSGKQAYIEKLIAEHLKKHPDTVVARYKNGSLIIEKPVKGRHS